MIEVISGLGGFLLGLVCFLAGMECSVPEKPAQRRKSEAVPEKELRDMEAEQRAFRALTGYSADIAYGIAEFPGEAEL